MFQRALLGCCLAATAMPVAAADYIVIRREIEVERPADLVWARVGDYCGITEWLKLSCAIVSGQGDVGTVRTLNNETIEPMVAKTARSYTYGQTVGGMANYAYNGTLAVEPIGEKRAKIVYTLIYDADLMPSDEVRKAQFERISTRFQGAVESMKAIAEAKP